MEGWGSLCVGAGGEGTRWGEDVQRARGKKVTGRARDKKVDMSGHFFAFPEPRGCSKNWPPPGNA